MRSRTWLCPLALLVFVSTSQASSSVSVSKGRNFGWRGGSSPERGATKFDENKDDNYSNDETVETYVAAMKAKDTQKMEANQELCDKDEEKEDDRKEPQEKSEESGDDTSSAQDPAEDPAVVGVKAHHHKKSNAVGDPDGDDDDDDTDDTISDFSDEWEEMEECGEFVEDLVVEPHLQVEVELVEESGAEDAEDDFSRENDKPSGGGGVGVRLGRMNSRRVNRRNAWRSASSTSQLSSDQTRLLEAWAPHVYFPPTKSALAYLTEHARMLDAGSKSRLDRRTLYAGLLMEWGSIETKLSTSSRKFLPSSVSQTLQAALSMATQPHWRHSSPRTSGIRLYQDEETSSKNPTLSMQETVAMALVRGSHMNYG